MYVFMYIHIYICTSKASYGSMGNAPERCQMESKLSPWGHGRNLRVFNPTWFYAPDRSSRVHVRGDSYVTASCRSNTYDISVAALHGFSTPTQHASPSVSAPQAVRMLWELLAWREYGLECIPTCTNIGSALSPKGVMRARMYACAYGKTYASTPGRETDERPRTTLDKTTPTPKHMEVRAD